MNPKLINPLGVGQLDDIYTREKQAEANKRLDWGVVPDAFKEGTVVDEVTDFIKLSRFKDDPDFKITDEMRNQNFSKYSQTEAEYLEKADSKAEYIQREANIADRRARQQRLVNYGGVGTAATLIAGFTDPVSLVAGAGVGKVIQVGRLAKTLAGGAAGLGESFVTAKFEQAYNPYMTDQDVLIQSVMGGSLGAIGGALSARGLRQEAEAAYQVEAAAQKAVLNFDPTRVGPVDELTALFKDQPDVDVSAIRAAIKARDSRPSKYDPSIPSAKVARGNVRKLEKERAKILDEMSASRLEAAKARNLEGKVTQVDVAAETIANRNKVREKYEPQIKELEAQIDGVTNQKKLGQLYKKLTDVQTRYERALDRASAKAYSKLDKPVEDDPKLVRKLESIETKLKEAQGQVAISEKNTSYRNKARQWASMSLKDKVQTLYGDSLPRLKSGSLSAAETQGTLGGAGVTDTELERVEFIREVTVDKDVDGNLQVFKDGFMSDTFNAVYTSLTSSKSEYVRGLAYLLFENPQGATRTGTVSQSSTSIESAVVGRMMRTAGGGAYVRNKAFMNYIRDNGKNIVTGHFDQALREKWNRDVMYAVDSKELYNAAPQYIKDAADSVRKQFEESLRLLKESGVKGFEDVKYSPHYVPKILNANQLVAAIARHGKEKVKYVISEAYQTGGVKLPKKAADKLAEVRMTQILRAKGTVEKPELPTTLEDLDYLRDELTKAGVDADVIEDILQGKADEMDASMVSDRAKASLKPNMRANFQGLSYFDLMNHDVENVMESYIREAAGNVAMKRTVGVGSYRASKRLLDDAKKAAMDEDPTNVERLEAEFEIISDAIDVIYGKSINKANQSIVKGAQRLRSLTSILRLQAMGLTNLGELPRVIAHQGIQAVLASNPLMKRERVKELGRKDLEEVDEILGFAGEDWAFEPITVDTDAFDELSVESTGRMARAFKVVDQALAAGQRVSGIANLFRVTQGVGERASIRGVVYNLKHGKVSEQQARDAGWIQTTTKTTRDEYGIPKVETVEVNRLDDLKKFMEEYPASHEGRKLLNVEKMREVDPELFMDIQRGVLRLSSRDMQRMHVGETPLFMNRWLGQTMSQFRTFPYAALSKQLIHDLRGDRAVAATTFMYSLGMAYMVNSARVALLAAGNPNKDFDEVWEERMEGPALGYNLLNSVGQLSGVFLGLDGLATFGLLPEEMVASQENNFIGASPLQPPVLGLQKDVSTVAQGVWVGDAEQVAKGIHNLTPFAKTIGISQMISSTYN